MIGQRRVGLGGPMVGAIGLGCMPMSANYGPPDERGGVAAIQRAIELGCNLLDTADAYGGNETLVGQAIRGRREQVVLATKFGLVRGPAGRERPVDGRPQYVRAACEASLQRLGVEAIDLYYLHRVDPAVPVEETVGAMADLVRQGKVRHIGLSEVGSEAIRRAHSVYPLSAVQSEYSLWVRGVEEQVLPLLAGLGIALVAYSPLGRGFLAGALRSEADLAADDWRRSVGRLQGENLTRNLEHLDRLEAVAAGKGCTTSQLTLAWLLARSPLVIPIPGTRRVEHLEENCRAAAIDLTPAELDIVTAAVDPARVAGSHRSPRDPTHRAPG